MKKIIYLLLFIVLCVSLTGCNFKTYSYKDMTGFEISDIKRVTYSNGPLQSFRAEFQGDYNKYLGVKYKFVGNDEKQISKFEEVRDNFSFLFDVEVQNSSEIIYFYVYNNKIYFVNNNVGLYESVDSFSLLNLKMEADGK